MTFQVLFATDGSPGADAARGLLAASFRPAEVSVDVVHVIAPPVAALPGMVGAGEVAFDVVRQSGERAVAEVADALRETGFHVSAEVAIGHPAAEIVRLAEARHADLVLVGTRGLTGLRRALVGSVAGSVARHAPTSVLMAHGPARIGHVLIGVDGSPNAEAALRLLERLPFSDRPRVTVATSYHVQAPLRSGIAPMHQAEADAAYREDLEAARTRATEIAERAAASLTGEWPEVQTAVIHGQARDALAAQAKDVAADLVVVGCRGVSGVHRFLLGSTSAALVAQPPTSVLVVHEPHPAG